MNELYFNQNNQEYIIEKNIYEDIYEYRDNDNITLSMLSSIILNKNKYIFSQILNKKKLNSEEKIYLLKMICKEGDEYEYFLRVIFKDTEIEEKEFKIIVEEAMMSGSVNILKTLSEGRELIQLDTEVINHSLYKNPHFELIKFLCDYYSKEKILNKKLLTEFINNDYVKLFKYYTDCHIYNDWNVYLDEAIKKNAYDIIDYILDEIKEYQVKEDIKYDDFFDYLMTENFKKYILFLSKSKNIFQYGHHNLEKLLLVAVEKNQFELLLFEYKLISIVVRDKELNHKVNKYLLRIKLNKDLKIKQQQEIHKI